MTIELTNLLMWIFERDPDGVFRYAEIEREVNFFIMIFDPENKYNDKKFQKALKKL